MKLSQVVIGGKVALSPDPDAKLYTVISVKDFIATIEYTHPTWGGLSKYFIGVDALQVPTLTQMKNDAIAYSDY